MRWLARLAFLLLFASPLYGQGMRYDNFVLKPLAAGGVTPVSGALITVCTSAGTGTPCTPKVANIYSDEALTAPITGTGGAGTTNSDANGNFGFYLTPGSYIATVTGSGITSYTIKLTLPIPNASAITCKSINGVRCADGTTFTTIEAAQTDCQNDSSINSCAILVKSGFRETFTSTIVVGTSTKSTIFYLQPDVTLTCNVSAGADCFQVMPASGFVGMNNFHSGLAGGLSGGPIITVASTANVGNVIVTAQGGGSGGQSSIRLENLLMPGTNAGGEAVTNWLHIQSVNNQPIVQNIFVNPSANSTGILIDASTASGAVMGPISLLNVFSDCQYRTGCHPAKITTGSPTANSVYNIDWNGGYINHPGSGLTNLEINGNSNTSKAVANIRIKAYFENLQNGATIGLKIVDAWDVDWSTSGFLMQDTDTCVDISESAANRTGSLHSSVFRCQSGTGLVKVVNNHITSKSFTAANNQDVPLYNFGGDSASLVAPFIIESNLFGNSSIFFGGADTITSAPTQNGPANNNAGWRYCIYTNTVCNGIASGTSAEEITAGSVHWKSFFNGPPNNNGGNTTPDTLAVFSISNVGQTTWKEATAPTTPGAGFDDCYGDSTAHGVKCSMNGGTYSTMPLTIASGTKALNTASVTTATCDAGAAVTATGTVSTDTVDWSFNAAPTATNKYGAFLVVYAVPSANTVTFYTCNPSATTSTPTAMTVNWSVRRP